ncbi:MAG: LapA family protein [Pseudomonadota bacterium]
MTRIVYLTALLLVACLAIPFYVRNKNVVEFDFLLGSFQIELAILLAGAFTVGALVAVIFVAPTLVFLRARISNISRKKDALERQLGVLKGDLTSDAQ